jgi:two-component system chemotaxis response regulator CheB
MIRALIVEDSPAVREFLIYILEADPEIEVAGTAHDGEEAVEAVERVKPDVVTMDIHMPKLNGFDATRRIMETRPTPIVIVSGSSTAKEVATTFNALEAGALAIVPRPRGIGHPEHELTARELVRTVKLMSEVKVVRRWPRSRMGRAAASAPRVRTSKAPAEIRAVAIGASTGGPVVLQTILSRLQKTFPAPVLIVQHIAPGFTEGFVDWLCQTTQFPVHIARQGETVLPGHAYVAPDGFHMSLQSAGRITLSKDEPENGLRPSVSYLFRSVAEVYGPHAVAVLLTGMGRDGAVELKLLKERNAVTIVQDKETCIVYGMPGEAIKLDAATYVLPPEKIGEALLNLVANRQETTP